MTALLCASPYCAVPGYHLAEPDHDEATCRGCQPARAADGLYLCGHCTARIGRDALDAATLHADLGQVLAGHGGRGDSGPGGRDPGIELDPVAVEARDAIRAVLVGLCRMVGEERGITLPRDKVLDMATYVARHARWLAAHAEGNPPRPIAGEHAQDLRDLVTDGRSKRVAYAVPGDRTLIGLCNQPGPGPGDDAGAVCGARIYVRDNAPTLGAAIACPGCGASGTVQWWRWELCAAADGREVVDAYEAAAFLSWRWGREVQPGLVWQWGRRYDDAGMLRVLCDVTPLGAVERELVEGGPLKDRQGRVLFVLGMLVQRAERMWGAPTGVLAEVGG